MHIADPRPQANPGFPFQGVDERHGKLGGFLRILPGLDDQNAPRAVLRQQVALLHGSQLPD